MFSPIIGRSLEVGDYVFIDDTLTGSGKKGYLFTENLFVRSNASMEWAIDSDRRMKMPLFMDALEDVIVNKKDRITFCFKDGHEEEGFFSIHGEYFFLLFKKIISMIREAEEPVKKPRKPQPAEEVVKKPQQPHPAEEVVREDDFPEIPILHMADENGTDREYYLYDGVEYEGDNYIYVMSAEDEDGEINILQVVDHGDGTEGYYSFDSDEKFAALFKLFIKRNAEKYNIDQELIDMVNAADEPETDEPAAEVSSAQNEADEAMRAAEAARVAEEERKAEETAKAAAPQPDPRFAGFRRVKPRINLMVLGHVDHGKSMLSAAIGNVLAKYVPGNEGAEYDYADIDKGGVERMTAVDVNISRIEYETRKYHVAHTDCPGHADIVKALLCGGTIPDAAILVISAADGPMAQTHEHIMFCRMMKIQNIIVFMNKCDMVDDPELLDLVEMNIDELLRSYEYEYCTFVRGSALNAYDDPGSAWGEGVMELMDTIDKEVPVPERNDDKPFLMPIEDAYTVRDRGTVATGRIESGTITWDTVVEILGSDGRRSETKVTGVEMFRKSLDQAMTGDNVGLYLRGVQRFDLERGGVICAPGLMEHHKRFQAEVYILRKDEGGRHTPFFNGYRPQVYLRTAEVTGVVTLRDGMEMIMPGDNDLVEIELLRSMPINVGQLISLREGGRTIAMGKIVEIIE